MASDHCRRVAYRASNCAKSERVERLRVLPRAFQLRFGAVADVRLDVAF